jgi:PST family polysaccharide transporter
VNPVTDQRPADGADLTRAARAGSAWAVAQALFSKLASLVGQVVLAWLLTPAQMGIASKAISVHGLFLFYNPAIMSDVLIQRKASFERDARPGLWIAIVFGTLTGLVMLGSAPLFATWYADPVVIGLIAVLALRPLAMAFQVVSVARLRMGFRFAALSNWSIWIAVGTVGLSIALAALGSGAYALVVPMVASLIAGAIIFSRLARGASPWPPSFAEGLPLWKEWTTLSAGQYAHTLSLFADYLVLAFFVSDVELGLYFFAFNLSGQLNGLVIYNTSVVLQPIFSELRSEPARQTRAFLKVATAMSAVTVPLCILQALLAEPLLRLIFGERWLAAWPLLAILSIGQAMSFAVGPVTALLKSQSRFGTYVRWQTIQIVLLVPALIAAAWLGPTLLGGEHPSATLVAWVIVAQYAISTPLGLWVAIRPGGGSLRDALRPFVLPALAAIPAVIPLWLAMAALPDSVPADLLKLVAVPPLALVGYAVGLRFVAPDAFRLVRESLTAIGRRLMSRAGVGSR